MNKFSILFLAVAGALGACQPAQQETTAADTLPADPVSAAALDTTQTLTTIAFGSCNNQREPQPLWPAILENDPDLWIWLGDNIYGDTHDMQAMQAMYAQQQADTGYQQLVQRVPVIGIWDDHDYGINDGGKNFSKKQESRDLMLDFLHVAEDSPVRNREGGYQAYTFGPDGQQVKIILLDTRYFRDTLKVVNEAGKRYGPSPQGDMLGEAQWQWLASQLNNSQAQVNIIGSSVQVLPEDHGYEKWANFPQARQRLLDLVAASGARSVVFLSGDRHIAEISRVTLEGVPYPVYDITSSGLTHVWKGADEPNRHRVGALVSSLNFGTISIDWNQQPPAVTYRIKGEDNKTYLTETVTYETAQAGR